MKQLKIETKRGVLLDGVLFAADGGADTVLIAITGIHGNFYLNPFYYNIGDTLSASGIDFIYAQTNDALGAIRTMNTHTGREEIIGSWNERFALVGEDIEAYSTTPLSKATATSSWPVTRWEPTRSSTTSRATTPLA